MARSVREVSLKQTATADRTRARPSVGVARGDRTRSRWHGARRRGAGRGTGRRAGGARSGRSGLAHRGPGLDAPARTDRRVALANARARGPASCGLDGCSARARTPSGCSTARETGSRGSSSIGTDRLPSRAPTGPRPRRRSASSPTRSGPRSRHGACARSFCASARRDRRPRHELLRGAPPPDTVQVEETGCRSSSTWRADRRRGPSSTSERTASESASLRAGRRVLNLFSYAGGFSLHAALGGATHVTSVDVAAAAHATAQAQLPRRGRRPERARIRHGRRDRIPRRRPRRRRKQWDLDHQRSAELRAEREGAPAGALRVPSAARRVRRRPGPGRHPLRRVVLEPRRRRGLSLDARRRGPRATRSAHRSSFAAPAPTTRPSLPSPRAATSSSRS